MHLTKLLKYCVFASACVLFKFYTSKKKTIYSIAETLTVLGLLTSSSQHYTNSVLAVRGATGCWCES